MIELYHLSEGYLRESTTLYPRIPVNSMTRQGYEDNRTARVCFTPSIQECLMSLSQKNNNKSFFVYTVDMDESRLRRMIVHPTKKQVPDVEITNEIWILNPVPVILVGTIIVIGPRKEKGFPYNYGDGRTAELYQWDFRVTSMTKKGIYYHGLQEK